LKETVEKVNMTLTFIDTRIGRMKGVGDLKGKLESLAETLKLS
jgi:hypothetical protein